MCEGSGRLLLYLNRKFSPTVGHTLQIIDSLLDIMMADQSKIFSHLKDDEILFFGPDENTADLMDAGALRARQRGYKFWKSLTTGKN